MNIDTSGNLPQSVDLRPNIEKIEDQGQIGSCTSNAACAMLNVLFEREHDVNPDTPLHSFSRLYLYYWERQIEGRLTEEGAFPVDTMKTLMSRGVCEENLWPYDTMKENVQPPEVCDLGASSFKIDDFIDLSSSDPEIFRTNIKHALAQGRPAILSFNVSEDFQTKGNTINDWRKFEWDIDSKADGGHEVLVIGYDDLVDRFLIQNSWGPDWCDGGFFGIPYNYFDLGVVDSALCSIQKIIQNVPVDGY
jgi:C1A family cysteine protease